MEAEKAHKAEDEQYSGQTQTGETTISLRKPGRHTQGEQQAYRDCPWKEDVSSLAGLGRAEDEREAQQGDKQQQDDLECKQAQR